MLSVFKRASGLHGRTSFSPIKQLAYDTCGKRLFSADSKEARLALLRKIYEPFSKLDKGSPEYDELARSGKVWEDHFQPYDSQRMGYKTLQQEHEDMLVEIDKLRELMKPRVSELAKTLVAEYAHQSVSIENNPLKIGDTIAIFDLLNKKLFAHIDIASFAAEDLTQLVLPQLHPDADGSVVNELKNHIVASQWIAETAAAQPGTSGMNEAEMRQLAAMTIKGTESEAIYAMAWGGSVPLGGYRKLPIAVRSNPLQIFPYHAEVPVCVNRFFSWRDSQHRSKETHPLILACHMTAYFVHIHPFPDGNGRVSRMIMHDYMVRQGYLPVVMQDLDRKDYLRMIDGACNGNPREFITTVLSTQLDQLHTFYWRQRMGDGA
ncbi:Putative Fido domain-containing protein [Colletotrichum destructivum]|uniref:Fido domain-containing protein n=1 Tax=Colletotrichum destructivum TaxID=34406 RepID=A0AAX4IF47_9PEZI|nr:Putative Fido domain-containing protein [Colletotrichum destructivum]